MKEFLERLGFFFLLLGVIWTVTYIAIMDTWAARWIIHSVNWPP